MDNLEVEKRRSMNLSGLPGSKAVIVIHDRGGGVERKADFKAFDRIMARKGGVAPEGDDVL